MYWFHPAKANLMENIPDYCIFETIYALAVRMYFTLCGWLLMQGCLVCFTNHDCGNFWSLRFCRLRYLWMWLCVFCVNFQGVLKIHKYSRQATNSDTGLNIVQNQGPLSHWNGWTLAALDSIPHISFSGPIERSKDPKMAEGSRGSLK